MIRGDLSARNLAEFVCRRGDLYAPRQGRQVDADEGVACQKLVQKQRLEIYSEYQCEVALTTEFVCGGQSRKLSGRADGIYLDGDVVVIEEFKACGELPDEADPVDFGQAQVYAGLVVATAPQPQAIYGLRVRVVYVHADSLAEACFEQDVSTDQAAAGLALMLLCYTTRVERHLARVAERISWATQLAFPLPNYRPSQQAIARRVYKALKQGENLLLEAPTGSGKSLGVLFPAVKALEPEQQLFFLTSRNAGARAALSAVVQLDPQHESLCALELTAKQKICPVQGMPCDPNLCELASGYFDRIGAAVNELLEHRLMDRAAIEQVAAAYQVCPFELSLDAALWADLVCGDYNYIFDPVVRLQRFSGHDGLHLLVDEAHQLSPRARDMLAVGLQRSWLKQAKKTSHVAMAKRVASLDRALMALRRGYGEGQHHGVAVDAVCGACSRLLEVAAEQELELEDHPELVELYLAVWRWQRSDSWLTADEFEHVLDVQGRDVVLRRICLDPARYLRSIYDEHGSVVRFSATVSPLPLYQRLHGLSDCGSSERAGSPFRREQALVMVVPDIPTYFTQRARTLPHLVSLVTQLVAAQPGRYLVACPSYAYLQALSDLREPGWGDVFIQQRAATPVETEDLITQFAAVERGVLFVVMGGVLGESVDFSTFSLKGTIMVGLGLPPPSQERNLIEAYFNQDQGDGWGRLVAYTQPALVKNIQAAGRLIRSERDVGVICLVDPRFTSSEVQRFFPAHWHPEVTRAEDVTARVTQFWLGQT